MNRDYNRILFIRLDKVGDMVLTTPSIRCMRNTYPDAHIALLASKYNKVVAEGWDCIDQLYSFDRDWSYSRKQSFLQHIGKDMWDLVVVLSPTTESYLSGAFIKAREKAAISYSTKVFSRLFNPLVFSRRHVVDVEGAIKSEAGAPHEVVQMLGLIEPYAKCDSNIPLEVPINENEVQWARGLLDDSCPGARTFVMHLSDKWMTQSWTGDDIASLARNICDLVPGSRMVLTYGPADAFAAAEVASALGGKRPKSDSEALCLENRIVMLGNLSFAKWAAMTSLGCLAISTDTGSLHVAVACGLPVVAVYEDASFDHCSRQWAPWLVPSEIVRKRRFSETADAIIEGARKLIGAGEVK